VPEVLRSVCVFPERQELLPVIECLRRLGVEHVTSIGVGECFVEGLLEAEGLRVCCVDLDIFPSSPALYDSYCVYTLKGEVTRLGNSAMLYTLPQSPQTALLFCFGKRLPWVEYVRRYAHVVPIVIIIGDERDDETGITQPAAYALRRPRQAGERRRAQSELGDIARGFSREEGADDLNSEWRIVHDGPCRAVMPTRVVVYVRKQPSASRPLAWCPGSLTD
jgi:hypothetical protein